ncbi:hypothetical protein ENHYDAX1_130400 [Enhydrobacter sp. AX1]|nr:hypothetical protein ENHYDAX1_130400 [Enhydrobacter sp. AX1]
MASFNRAASRIDVTSIFISNKNFYFKQKTFYFKQSTRSNQWQQFPAWQTVMVLSGWMATW